MDCPTCSRPLTRTTYENVQVMQCEECFGYLVARRRLKLIKSTREMGPEALHEEVRTEQAPDSRDQLRCPKCLAEVMRKERVRVSDEQSFHLDVCRKCDNVWLDGGELARLQIKFEQSAKALDAFAHQERIESLSGDERTELEERIDKLEESPGVFGASMADLGLLATVGAFLLGTVLALILERPVISFLLSLALCAALAYALVRWFGDTGSQKLGLGLLVVAEVAYLAALSWFF